MIQTSPAVAGALRFDTNLAEQPSTTIDIITTPTRLTWWGSIIAGAFTAISLQIIFMVLGTAIGLSVIGATNNTPEQGLSIGAGIWWLVTGLISLFVGGWVAGRLCASASYFICTMHGFLAWCSVTVVSALLVATAGSTVLAGSLGVVGDVVGNNTRASQQFGLGADDRWPSARDEDSVSRADRVERSSSGTDGSAGNRVEPLTEREQKDAAARAAGASWWTFIALVLGATVSSIGGAAGARCGVTGRGEGTPTSAQPRTISASDAV